MTALHYGVAGRQLELVTAALQDGASPTMPAGPHSVLTLVVIASYAAAPSPRYVTPLARTASPSSHASAKRDTIPGSPSPSPFARKNRCITTTIRAGLPLPP